MKVRWTKTDYGWLGIYGKFRATVRGPNPPLGFHHWTVRAGDISGGSGGTSSASHSKREAETEIARFAKFLKERK